MKYLPFMAAAVIFLSGCAHVISSDVLRDVNARISFVDLRGDPASYEGELVLLGGVIVETLNQEKGTLLEIYQTDLDSYGRPEKEDVSGGRFMAFSEAFLDSEIFRRGRKVTIAGTVKGERIKKLGEIDYRYPYILIREIHLWRKVRPYRYYDPYPFYYSPWYPWRPWHDPYWRYGPYHRY